MQDFNKKPEVLRLMNELAKGRKSGSINFLGVL